MIGQINYIFEIIINKNTMRVLFIFEKKIKVQPGDEIQASKNEG